MRKIFLAFSLIGVLITGAFAQLNYEETTALMADHKIMELGDKYLALLSNMYPEEATRLGTGVYHDQLLQRDKQNQTTRIKSLEALQKTLKQINPKKLSVNKRMQYYTLLGQVNKKIFEEKTLDQFSKDPLWYLQSLVSVYDIVEKNFTKKEDRVRDAIKRLEAFPQILQQGQENINNAPDLKMRLAAQKAQIAYASFGELSAKLEKLASSEQAKEKIKRASENSKKALKSYYDFLKETLEKQDYTDFRLGQENYLALLRDVYFVDGTIAKHTKNIETEIQHAREVLTTMLAPYMEDILNEEEKAQRTDSLGNIIILPSDYYLVKNAKFASAPQKEYIADAYVSNYEQAVKFFTEKELVAMPVLALALENNPQFLRQEYVMSDYLAPYPFAERKNSDLLLSVPLAKGKNVGPQLFTYSDIKIDTVQQLLPGISLSYNATNDSQQVLINVSDDMFYINGWKQYALQFAQEQGYFEEEADKLNIAWLNYKRALYAYADIKMQTKELNYTQTLDMLINAGIRDEEATAKVDYLAVNPLEALSYIVGAKEFEKLNLKYKKKLKDNFSQLQFNNNILSLGRVPLKVLGEGIDQAYKVKPVESFFSTTYF